MKFRCASRPLWVAWQSRGAYGPYVPVIEGANGIGRCHSRPCRSPGQLKSGSQRTIVH